MKKQLAAFVSSGVLMLTQAAAALAAPTDCADWNSYTFFHESTVAQIQDCLDSGADPKQRSGEGLLPIEGARLNDYLDDAGVLQRLEDASANDH